MLIAKRNLLARLHAFHRHCEQVGAPLLEAAYHHGLSSLRVEVPRNEIANRAEPDGPLAAVGRTHNDRRHAARRQVDGRDGTTDFYNAERGRRRTRLGEQCCAEEQ